MPDIVPSGSISLSLDALRALVAATDKWQTWTDSDDAAAGKERVYLCDIPKPVDGSETVEKAELQLMRPFGRVDLFNEDLSRMAWHAQKNAETSFQDSGVFILDLIDDVPEQLAEDMGQAKLKFLNDVGELITEMLRKTPDGGYLTVHSVTARDPERVSAIGELSQGDFWTIRLLIEWGI